MGYSYLRIDRDSVGQMGGVCMMDEVGAWMDTIRYTPSVYWRTLSVANRLLLFVEVLWPGNMYSNIKKATDL